MDANNVIENGENEPIISAKNIIRIFAAICFIICFCPTFLVSCADVEQPVSAYAVMKGIDSGYREIQSEPYPMLCIVLILPIVIMTVSFMGALNDRGMAGVILLCALADMGIWFVMKNEIKKYAEENYCNFYTTGWYTFNMISLSIIIVLSLSVVLGVIGFSKISIKSGPGGVGVINIYQPIIDSRSVNNESEDVIGYCKKCGSVIRYGRNYCTRCGEAVPEAIILEAEAKRKAREEASYSVKTSYCAKCGAKLKEGAVFCTACGTKVENK